MKANCMSVRSTLRRVEGCATVIAKGRTPDTAGLEESVKVAEKLKVPVVVGVPLRTPPELSVNPGGSEFADQR